MSLPIYLIRTLHLAQAALSLYTASASYTAINNLLTYEETTKKLAKWSDEVGKQLRQTRTTQGAGVVAIALSLLTSTTLLLTPSSTLLSHPWALYTSSPLTLLTIVAARKYMQSYWAPSDGKNVGVRIPLPKAGDYNEAQKATERVLELMQWVEWSWVGVAGLSGLGVWGRTWEG